VSFILLKQSSASSNKTVSVQAQNMLMFDPLRRVGGYDTSCVDCNIIIWESRRRLSREKSRRIRTEDNEVHPREQIPLSPIQHGLIQP